MNLLNFAHELLMSFFTLCQNMAILINVPAIMPAQDILN